MLNQVHPPLDQLRIARGNPSAGTRLSGRGRALLLVAGALLAWPTTVHAEDESPPIEYQFLRPAAPGEPFSLRFTVLPGYLPAVMITNRLATEPTDDSSFDSTTTLILPLPIDPSGTFTGVDGVLPEGVTAEEFENSIVEFRLILFDPLTELFVLSDPLTLQEEEEDDDEAPPDEDPADDSDSSTSDDEALTAQDMSPGGEGSSSETDEDPDTETVSDEEDGNEDSAPGKPTTYSVGWNLISTTPLGTLATRTLSSAALLSIYDQPTPVQGSGH